MDKLQYINKRDTTQQQKGGINTFDLKDGSHTHYSEGKKLDTKKVHMVQFYLCEIFKQTKLIHSQNLEQWLPLDGYYGELTRKRTFEGDVNVLYLDKGESISQSSWKCTYIISVFQYT